VVDGNTVLASFRGDSAELSVTTEPFSAVAQFRHTETSDGVTIWTRDVDLYLDTRIGEDQASGLYTQVYTPYTDGVAGAPTAYEGFVTLGNLRRLDATENEGLTLLGGIAQEEAPVWDELHLPVNVRVDGNYAYVAHYIDGLYVYDVSDPAAMVRVGSVAPDASGEVWNDVKLLAVGGRTYALCAGSIQGLSIVDVTDPAAPVIVAHGYGRNNVHTLAIEGTTAYLATVGGAVAGGLLMLDLSDPANPVELGDWSAIEAGGSFVHDLYVSDGIAYLCSWQAGLVLLDVSDPTAPVMLGQAGYEAPMTSHSVWVTEVGGRKVALEGGEDWGTRFRVIDVDPLSAEYLQVIGELALPEQVSMHNIMMGQGTTAVVSWYQYGVRLIDVADPTAPVLSGWANTWNADDLRTGQNFFEGAVGVDVVGDKVYVADIYRELLVYQLD
jgi:hypothetical protein